LLNLCGGTVRQWHKEFLLLLDVQIAPEALIIPFIVHHIIKVLLRFEGSVGGDQ